ncbi:MAG: hypothetical protein J6N45_07855 [Alphaproteobacteria bacterium]|nr:hypothetical protein [Alphaproteobacteria bacterium]
MTKQNEKTVLEHLLDNNKKMILASRYQNTIYNGKTLCEYFGVESKTKKEGAPLKELVDKVLIKDFPYLYITEIGLNKKLYETAPNFYLRYRSSLFNIKNILKYLDNNIVPISFNYPTPLNPMVHITYYNFITNEENEKVYDRSKTKEAMEQVKWYLQETDNIKILSELSVEDYLKYKKWKKEKVEKELDEVRFDKLKGNDDGTE